MAIHHVVFIKFKADAAKDKVRRFIRELNKLPELNREVKNWISGYSPEPRFHNGDFDYGLACDLADWDAMNRYMYHEGHLRTAPFAEPVFDYSMSFDFQTDFVQPKRYPPKKAVRRRGRKIPAAQARVPLLFGHHTEGAKKVLAAAGLTPGRVETQQHKLGLWAPGWAIGQSLEAGSIVPKGSTVDIFVTGEHWVKPQL